MEPERKIEKLLRAYAEKRRAAAGDPLKLHPATRRQLQDEVSRRAPKPEPEEPSLSLWQLFRQQWAILFGFALMVFLGAMFLLPPLSSVKREAQSISTLNNLKQLGLAAQMVAGENNGQLPASLDELTNGLVSRETLTDPESGKPFVYLASGVNLDNLHSNDVLAYSPADKDGRAVLLADGRVEFADRARFSELTNRKSIAFTLADSKTRAPPVKAAVANEPAPAVTPPAALGVARELKEKEAGSGAMQSFVQTGAANQQNLYRNTSAAAQTAPVLQSFQMVQNGDIVSVVDRDGSVYQGSVQVTLEKGNEAAKAMASKEEALPAQLPAKPDHSLSNQQQAAGNYFFRVAGLNRTLKQNIVFSGTVEAVPGALTNVVQGFAGGGGGGGGGWQSNLQASTNLQQTLLSNSRVVGMAVIDNTNQIEINAVPVTQ